MSAFDWEPNISEMNSFAKIWEQIASPTFRRTLLEEMGKTAVALVEQEFATGTNPYGRRWPGLKQPLHSGKTLKWFKTPTRHIGAHVLNKSGALATTIRYKIMGESVIVYSPLKYAIFHQRGTKWMPQRLIFPEDLIGLPERWKRAFDGAATKAFQQLLYNAAFR